MTMPTGRSSGNGAERPPRAVTRAGGVQSVDRAVQVMEILARDGRSGVGRIAKELGVHQSTVSRLVAALEAHDLVERQVEGGAVQLGVGILRLAAATRSRQDLTAVGGPVCDALAEQLGETVNLAVYRSGAAVNLYQAQGTRTVALHNWVGDATVLHATSSGKVLLAHLPPAQSEAVITGDLERFTAQTIVEADALRAQLQEAAVRGWAVAEEEYEEGLNAVAAAICGPEGNVIAALSAAGPAYRLGRGRLPEVAEQVRQAAKEISRRLGHRPEMTG
ncbi:IclR family transcriptional regulator [uncultured Brachybacterium sp.]|uniref:IclR family transcriptional regulator n=1 Tax=uncultured Brachybacterium sp. TaxID=189680 RepID=UPI00261AD90C|nr:IclR family transcriptional regulator [uncultured Brachybacterium sp.]